MRKPGAAFMERLLAEEFSGTGRAMTQTAALRLVGILDEDGEYDRSLALLESPCAGSHSEQGVAISAQPGFAQSGTSSRGAWRAGGKPPSGVLSGIYRSSGGALRRLRSGTEWFALLEREARSGSANRRAAAIKLRELAMEVNDSSRAAAAMALIGSASSGPPLQVKSPANEADWKRALAELGNAGKTEEERFRAGRSFLVLQDDLPASLRAQELARLERIARRNRSLARVLRLAQGTGR